jgi:plasmid replication initiation protein
MKLEQQEHNIFNKPSILVNLAHSTDLSLNSLKVYNFVIRKLFKQDITKDTKITTTYKEIAEYLGYEKYSNMLILDYIIELEECSVKTKTFNYKRNDWSNNLITRLISAIIYDEIEQTMTLEISQGLRDWILKYKDTFAKLDLNEMKLIKSKHTLKLYELFKDYSYHRNHKMNINQSDLFDFLNIEKDTAYYNNPAIFNRNIIKKALNEINTKTFMTVEFTYYRTNKDLQEPYYQFNIKDITRYSFNNFKATFLEYVKIKNITIKFNKKDYTFCEVENKNKMNTMIVKPLSFNTVETEEATELWQYLYNEMNYNTLNFCELYDIDFNDFNFMYNRLKEKKKDKKIIVSDKNEEIIIHKNQKTITDFL